MKKHKITVHDGDGVLTGATSLKVTAKDGKDHRAAGQERYRRRPAPAPATCPFAKADGNRIWTYRHAMVPKEMPTNLSVIGSGAIGVEFASFYSDMGAKVTIVEMLDRILPVEDADISAHAHKGLHQAGHDHPHLGRRREAGGDGAGRPRRDQDEGREGRDAGLLPRHRRHRHRPNSESIGLERSA
jgi:dihydrolipoamide dehydrogenase